MDPLLTRLEERVSAATELIGRLRAAISRLESELAERAGTAAAQPAADPERRALAEEVERLRAERAAVRERIRGLIREIDTVTW